MVSLTLPLEQLQQLTLLYRHGSRATNYGGILGQGLRIAPPEAPVNGYEIKGYNP